MPGWRSQPQTYHIAYHHFPLSYHKNAFAAAEAGECAAQQGKFWEYADELFGQYTGWIRKSAAEVPAQFKTYAASTRLEAGRFQTCLSSHAGKAEVQRQMKAAAPAFLTGTPTVYMNGVKLSEMSREEEKAVLDVTLTKPGAAAVIQNRLKSLR